MVWGLHFMRSLLLSLASIGLSLTGAHAATVTFDPANGFHSNVREVEEQTPAGQFITGRGTWIEDGFTVDWAYQDNVYDPDVARWNFTGGAFLSDCFGGCFDTGLSMTFSRPGGAAFSLRQMFVGETRSSFIGEASFTPYDQDGNLVFEETVYQRYPVVFDNIGFNVRTASGRTYEASASSMLEGTVLREGFDREWPGGDGVFRVEEPLSLVFDDMVSLTVSATPAANALSLGVPSRRERLLEAGAPPVFRFLPDDCGWSCDFPRFGRFEIFEDGGNTWNWGTAFVLDDFVFEVSDTPAPIPLPSGGVLLITALGALGLRARLRA